MSGKQITLNRFARYLAMLFLTCCAMSSSLWAQDIRLYDREPDHIELLYPDANGIQIVSPPANGPEIFNGSCVDGRQHVAVALKYDLDGTPTTLDWSYKVGVKLYQCIDGNCTSLLIDENGETNLPIILELKEGAEQTFISTVLYDPENGIACNELSPSGNVIDYHLEITSVEDNNAPLANITLESWFYTLEEYGVPDPVSVLTVGTHTDISLEDWYQVTWGNNDIPANVWEYDIEWVFIDAHESDIFNEFANQSPMTVSEDAFEYKGAGRTTLSTEAASQFGASILGYAAQGTYPEGKLYYRIRAVGRHSKTYAQQPVYSNWTYATPYEVDFEKERNWQVVTTFAEDAKSKKVMSYFDGTLRPRQVLTDLSTDGTTLVGESLYDYEGRASISVLPTPINKRSLHFQQGLNYFDIDDTEFANANEVDVKALYDNRDRLSPSLDTELGMGAGVYYSANNQMPENYGTHRDYIPDANGFPYVQTEFVNDGTGRVRRQSGVGGIFQLRVPGSDGPTAGKITEYHYGNPARMELTRLFGEKNIGDIKFYNKQLVVDPNGQVSVSYTDAAGRVIATALAGTPPANVDALDAYTDLPTDMVEVDLSENNLLDEDLNTSITTSAITNSDPQTTYYFDYNLAGAITEVTNSELTGTGNDQTVAICVTCEYFLEIEIRDPDGNLVEMTMTTKNDQGEDVVTVTEEPWTETIKGADCTSGSYNVKFNATFSSVGTHTVTKKLSLAAGALDLALKEIDAIEDSPNSPIKDVYDEINEDAAEHWDDLIEACTANTLFDIDDQTKADLLNEALTTSPEELCELLKQQKELVEDDEIKDLLQCHIDACEQHILSAQYNNMLFSSLLVDWNDAYNSGSSFYTNPLNMDISGTSYPVASPLTNVSVVNGHDPYFFDPDNSMLGTTITDAVTRMEELLNKIEFVMDDGSVLAASIWSLIDDAEGKYPIELKHTYPDNSVVNILFTEGGQPIPDAEIAERRWTLFRGFYLMQKNRLHANLLVASTCMYDERIAEIVVDPRQKLSLDFDTYTNQMTDAVDMLTPDYRIQAQGAVTGLLNELRSKGCQEPSEVDALALEDAFFAYFSSKKPLNTLGILFLEDIQEEITNGNCVTSTPLCTIRDLMNSFCVDIGSNEGYAIIEEHLVYENPYICDESATPITFPKGAYGFFGTYAIVEGEKALGFDELSGDFTLEAWVQIDAATASVYTRRPIISRIADNAGFEFGLTSDNQIYFWLDGQEVSTTMGGGVSSACEQCHHVAVSYNATSKMASIYHNGLLVVSEAFNSEGASALGETPLYLGGKSAAAYLDAIMQEVRIWNKVVPIADLGYTNEGNLPLDESSVFSWWPMDERQGTRFNNKRRIEDADIVLTNCSGDIEELLLVNTGTCRQCDDYTASFENETEWILSEASPVFGAEWKMTNAIANGPANPTEGSYYLAINVKNFIGNATAESPCLDMTDASSGYLTYDYFNSQGNEGFGILEVKEEGATTWQGLAYSHSEDITGGWRRFYFDLVASGYEGEQLKVRFRVNSFIQSSTDHIIAVDNLTFRNNGVGNACLLSVLPHQFQQDFDGTLNDWENSSTTTMIWEKWNTNNQTHTDAPNQINYSDNYMAVAVDSYNGDKAYLTSPCIDLSAAGSATLRYQLYMKGSLENTGRFSIEVREEGQTGWIEIDNYQLSNLYHGGDWLNRTIDLTAYAEQSIQVRFVATAGNATGVIAVDRIRIEKDVNNGSVVVNPCTTIITSDYTEHFNVPVTWTNYGALNWSTNPSGQQNVIGGTYMGLGVSNQSTGDKGYIETPCIDLRNMPIGIDGEFDFYYKAINTNVMSFRVEVLEDVGGTNWQPLTPTADTEVFNGWRHCRKDLGVYRGKIVRFRFVSEVVGNYNNNSPFADIKVDNVNFCKLGTGTNCLLTYGAEEVTEPFVNNPNRWLSSGDQPSFVWEQKDLTYNHVDAPHNLFGPGDYMAVAIDGQVGNRTYLTSPCIDLTDAAQANLDLRLWMFGAGSNTGAFYAEAREQGTTDWIEIGNYSLPLSYSGGSWDKQSFSLNAFAGKTIEVRLIAEAGTGSEGVIAVDHIHLTKSSIASVGTCSEVVASNYTASFTTLPSWTQAGELNWSVIDGHSNGPSTGVNTQYLAAEISGKSTGDQTILTLPCVDLRQVVGTSAAVRFYFYLPNETNFRLEAWDETVQAWTTISTLTGPSANTAFAGWDYYTQSLSNYLGTIVRLRLVGSITGNYTNNAPSTVMAIDEFQVEMSGALCRPTWYESSCIPGTVELNCVPDLTKINTILVGTGLSEEIDEVALQEQCKEELEEKKQNEIETRKEEARSEFAERFLNQHYNDCFSTPFQEELTYSFQPREYHYTLYYYDAAGSLVQTVPPEGVKIAAAGADYAAHELKTRYAYNVTGGMEWQHTPDGGTSEFWYDELGRLQLSQNAQQKVDKHYSYTKYDKQGRIVEVGQLEKKKGTDGAVIDLNKNELLAGITSDDLDFPSADNYVLDQRTLTHYDEFTSNMLANIGTHTLIEGDNLRGRVVATEVVELAETEPNALIYSYDVHGNVKEMQSLGFNARTIRYNYDLVSGNVNHVIYQPNTAGEFIHRYTYDADNRIVSVETSLDRYIWAQEAQYYYYAHGPLARTELGEHKVQGLDYAYTLQGWIKGVNTPGQQAEQDLGGDGVNGSYISKDIMAYQLGYFAGDYAPIGTNANLWEGAQRLWSQFNVVDFADYKQTAEVPLTTNAVDYIRASEDVNLGNGVNYEFKAAELVDLESGFDANGNGFDATIDAISGDGAGRSLYNGNIAWMVTDLAHFGANGTQAMAYRYDQLNRIKKGESHKFNGTGWVRPTTSYDVNYSYDGNGNLQTLQRHDASGNLMDDLSYTYDAVKKNRLLHVSDASGNATGKDFETQQAGNYAYDAIGNLIKDNSENIEAIEWTIYGKVKSVRKKNAANEDIEVRYTYDASGNRSAKRIYKSGQSTTVKATYYYRDASGNMMETESITTVESQPDQRDIRKEYGIYGSSRIGYYRSKVRMDFADPINPIVVSTNGNALGNLSLGNKQYELSNHLGNVLTVISDRKTPLLDENNAPVLDQNGSIALYVAHVVSANDYYPFGLSMEGRKFEDEEYRYGFNGKENDKDFGNSQLIQDYGFRLYNPSIARFLSVDPLAPEYAELSPYQFASLNPIKFIDLDGLEGFLDDWSTGMGKIGSDLWSMAKSGYTSAKTKVITEKAKLEEVGAKQYTKDAIKKTAEDVKDNVVSTGHSLYNLYPAVNNAIQDATGSRDYMPYQDWDSKTDQTKERITEGPPVESAMAFYSTLGYAEGALGIADLVQGGVKNFAKGRRLKPNPCGCFTAETLVLTSDGYKEIVDVSVGDSVWAYNDITGELALREVIDTIRLDFDELFNIYVGDIVISATYEHPFYVNNKWVEAEDLIIGDSLTLFDGSKKIIHKIVVENRSTRVYNLTVKGYHTYYVSELNVLVHNCHVSFNGILKFTRTNNKGANAAKGHLIKHADVFGYIKGDHRLQKMFAELKEKATIFMNSADEVRVGKWDATFEDVTFYKKGNSFVVKDNTTNEFVTAGIGASGNSKYNAATIVTQ